MLILSREKKNKELNKRLPNLEYLPFVLLNKSASSWISQLKWRQVLAESVADGFVSGNQQRGIVEVHCIQWLHAEPLNEASALRV